jgi:DNA-binding CsgD family transcriptional regulator/PAS domain-containing protein
VNGGPGIILAEDARSHESADHRRMPSTLSAPESSLGAIERLAGEGLSAQALLEQAAARIDRVVPADGLFMAATDPETTLAIGTGLVRDLPADQCQPHWDYEFLVPDYLKFADIARSGRRVADLHDATGGRPERSPRFKQYSVATGFSAEVRMAFTVGEQAWGLGQLNRLSGRFTDDEKAWLERAAEHVARGLRRAMVSEPATCPSPVRGPGVVLLDEDARVVSATREAVEWLGELAPELLMSDVGDLRLPFHAHGFATRVRAAHEDGEPQIRSRLRTRHGVWLLMHGAVLEGTGLLTLVIEPAKSADIAPLIVEAYGLNARELDVNRAIARGLGTSQIAAELFLSPHTVRDHVKSVFEKVGVSSRGELVHRVFAEHYSAPSH